VHAIVEAPKIDAAMAPKKLANGVNQADLQDLTGAMPLSSHTRHGIEQLAELIKNIPGKALSLQPSCKPAQLCVRIEAAPDAAFCDSPV
jgi:hypothetical protein